MGDLDERMMEGVKWFVSMQHLSDKEGGSCMRTAPRNQGLESELSLPSKKACWYGVEKVVVVISGTG